MNRRSFCQMIGIPLALSGTQASAKPESKPTAGPAEEAGLNHMHDFEIILPQVAIGGEVRMDGKVVRGIRAVHIDASIDSVTTIALDMIPKNIKVKARGQCLEHHDEPKSDATLKRWKDGQWVQIAEVKSIKGPSSDYGAFLGTLKQEPTMTFPMKFTKD